MKRMPAEFDKELSSRILPVGKDDPLFIDFDKGHFLSPPFALEPADRGRPLTLSNLAFPEKLKEWVRRHGIDAAVQVDGRTITLIGLEMKGGQPVPNPDGWPRLTPADVLRLFRPLPGQPRSSDLGRVAPIRPPLPAGRPAGRPAVPHPRGKPRPVEPEAGAYRPE